eukprot:1155506-Pelagomonas_calceolata.AAC.2
MHVRFKFDKVRGSSHGTTLQQVAQKARQQHATVQLMPQMGIHAASMHFTGTRRSAHCLASAVPGVQYYAQRNKYVMEEVTCAD